MRLKAEEIEKIRSAVEEHFGIGSGIWLFGSALDDKRRGGDIDLYVEPSAPLPKNLFLASEELTRTLEKDLRRPVDLVVRRDRPSAFMRQAQAEGQRL